VTRPSDGVELRDQLDIFVQSRRRSIFSDSSTTELRLSGLGRPYLLAAECQQLLREFGCAYSCFADLLDLRPPWVRFRQLMVDEVAVAVDNREEIVEIVRHAAGESADALHFLGLHIPLL
jgi:hypothetical protein